MKIFIPFTIRETGGTSSFAKKFKEGLEAQDHTVFFRFQEDYDILFVIVQCSPLYLLHAKFHKRKIVQRLDGVYYWSVASWKYLLLNFPPRFIHTWFSDFTIYQSHYSQYCADTFLGKCRDQQHALIYNGVSTHVFSPEGEKVETLRDNPQQTVFITVSQFRRSDQILPLIEAMEIYRSRYNTNCKLIIIGDFSREVADIPNRFKKCTYLHFLGTVRNADLPKYERSADVFLMTHLNPPCPNNVIEAMACGLPICGVNDGAMGEITIPGENSRLIPVEGDAFWKRRVYNMSRFADNLAIIMQARDAYAKSSRRIAEQRFELTTMIEKYVQAFESLRK